MTSTKAGFIYINTSWRGLQDAAISRQQDILTYNTICLMNIQNIALETENIVSPYTNNHLKAVLSEHRFCILFLAERKCRKVYVVCFCQTIFYSCAVLEHRFCILFIAQCTCLLYCVYYFWMSCTKCRTDKLKKLEPNKNTFLMLHGYDKIKCIYIIYREFDMTTIKNIKF